MHPESRIDTMQNIKFKTCIIDGQERYAFATIDENGQMTEMPAQMFPESLLSFMDIDMSRVSELFSAMNDCIISLPDIADTKYLDKLLYILEALAQQHIYFELFRLDWTGRIRQAQSANVVKSQWRKCRVRNMPKVLKGIQHQAKELFVNALDYDRGNGTVLEKAVSYYKMMDGAAFSFRPQFMHFELWDDSAFAEVLYPESICGLISYHLQECVKRELRFRICKNCGRYFYMSGRNTAMYCYRPYDENGHTCRRIAPVRAWSERNQKDKIFHEYRREYKRRFAWINAGKIERDAFYAWSKQAKEKKAECAAGIISYEDFIEWLRAL